MRFQIAFWFWMALWVASNVAKAVPGFLTKRLRHSLFTDHYRTRS